MADTLLQALGYFSDNARTNAQAKQAQDDIIAYLRERFGNTDGVIDFGIRKLKVGGPLDQAKGADLASGATVDLGGATGNLVHVTGAAVITSFGNTATAGVERVTVFDGAATLTHNAASLILPTGANIVTAAGDVAVWRCESVGVWRCISYMRANGQPLTGAAGSLLVVAGEAIDASAAPKLVYKDVFNQRGGGASRWYLVDSDATAPVRISPIVGIAISSATGIGSTFTCQVQPGQVSGFAGLTADSPLWASGTAGGLTQTEPAIPASGSQNAVRMVGYATGATTIMFEPWHDTVFQARSSALTAGSSVTVEHYTDSGARERVARSYIAAPGADTRIVGATPYAPNGGTAANVNDNSAGTTCVAYLGGGGWPTSGSARFLVYLDFGSIYQLSKAEAKQLYLASGTGYEAAFYTSTDAVTWTKFGANFGYGPSAGDYTRTGSVSARYLGLSVTETYNGGGINVTVSDLNGYYAAAGRDEPVTVGSESVNSTSTDRVTVKFADAVDTGQDIKTTFINRTGAARDFIVEVTL